MPTMNSNSRAMVYVLDTNILIYAVSTDDARKHGIAQALLATALEAKSGQCVMVSQVLGEFMSATTRRGRLDRASAAAFARNCALALKVVTPSIAAFDAARGLFAQHQYQFWDALIVATCAEHGVQRLYTEDLGSLPMPLGVELVNPFDVSV